MKGVTEGTTSSRGGSRGNSAVGYTEYSSLSSSKIEPPS